MAQEGTVKWFSEEKGYGFISPEDGGETFFVHYTAYIEGESSRSLEEGERALYEVSPRSERRARAIEVHESE